jgi:hypothetical protein
MNHGDDEVADEDEGDGADEDGFHRGVRSKGLAEPGIESAESEESECGGEVDEVVHGGGR